MSLKKTLFLFIAIVITNFSLQAEIEIVTVKWNPYLCIQNCPSLLVREFKKTQGVDQITINEAQGQADITWRPNVPFTFQQINIPTRMIGIRPHDMRVRARGTISHTDRTVTLTSSGDGTQFLLLGPITPSVTNQVIQHNIQNNPLPADRRDQLINAERQKQTVTIEGPLFAPQRSPPLMLIVEQLQVNQGS